MILIRPPAARRLALPAITRPQLPAPARLIPSAIDLQPLSVVDLEPGPYEDYGRTLTPQGGVLIFYKDLDLRLRQYAWRILAWLAFTGGEGWYVQHHSPVTATWVNLLCVIAIAVANWLILRKPSECHRQIEIRPDCLIVEGTDVFWRHHMEGDPPALQRDNEGNQRVCTIYGTRLVEFGIIRRFDQLDRTPEVIGAHLQDAFEQLWGLPE